jgi:hypothetical protein
LYIGLSSVNFHKNFIGSEWIKNSIKNIHNKNFDPYKQLFWVETKLTKQERTAISNVLKLVKLRVSPNLS